MSKKTPDADTKVAGADPVTVTVAVRVLVDCQYGTCNSHALIPANDLASAKAAGLVDDHETAVAAVAGDAAVGG